MFPGRDASGERLQDKPVLVAANKIDALDDPERLGRLQQHLQRAGIPLYAVSAATGDGLTPLVEAMWQQVAVAPRSTALNDARSRGARRIGLLGGTFDPYTAAISTRPVPPARPSISNRS